MDVSGKVLAGPSEMIISIQTSALDGNLKPQPWAGSLCEPSVD